MDGQVDRQLAVLTAQIFGLRDGASRPEAMTSVVRCRLGAEVRWPVGDDQARQRNESRPSRPSCYEHAQRLSNGLMTTRLQAIAAPVETKRSASVTKLKYCCDTRAMPQVYCGCN